ncbi:hypothetical protein C2845_PM01G22090 [Panicum miliaceum]|uniref:At1g61320/AtMIF1 LRR domain-containing protein n=1 Tax=Panicum miliaceum TaxID=4540 RepID=A0A3L6TVX5_PANMI|nr:hypothetical protein C2845_PM01G22090 [Panicum miliaceum]
MGQIGHKSHPCGIKPKRWSERVGEEKERNAIIEKAAAAGKGISANVHTVAVLYYRLLLCAAAARDGLIDSTGKRKGSPCEQDGDSDSQAGKIMRSIPELPEVVDAPMLPTKFLCLKHLTIYLVSGSTVSRPYDHFSLVSFLEAAPFLQTLILNVRHC